MTSQTVAYHNKLWKVLRRVTQEGDDDDDDDSNSEDNRLVVVVVVVVAAADCVLFVSLLLSPRRQKACIHSHQWYDNLQLHNKQRITEISNPIFPIVKILSSSFISSSSSWEVVMIYVISGMRKSELNDLEMVLVIIRWWLCVIVRSLL
jgi:hypothetical protein